MNKPLFPEIVVNGTTLAPADIAAEAQNHHAPKGKPGLAWRRAARALAIRQLMLEAAAAQGLETNPRELAPGQVETDEEALIRALMEQAVTPEPVREADLRAAYDRNPGAYRAPSLYQAAHILFAARPGDQPARTQARARAEATLETLRRTPGKFAAIAGRESECASRDMGGELGQLTGSDVVPEFAAAMAVAGRARSTATWWKPDTGCMCCALMRGRRAKSCRFNRRVPVCRKRPRKPPGPAPRKASLPGC